MPLRTQDFFLNVKDILRKPESTSVSAHNYRQAEKDLQDKYGSVTSFAVQHLSFRVLCCPLLEFRPKRHFSHFYRGIHTVVNVVVVVFVSVYQCFKLHLSPFLLGESRLCDVDKVCWVHLSSNHLVKVTEYLILFMIYS